MPSPSIVATSDPLAGNVVITVNWALYPSVTFARVQRVNADGSTSSVRTNTSSDSSGDFQELSGGVAVFYDVDVPFDVSLTYVTSALSGTTDTGVSSEIVVPSGGNIWLRDPLNPFNNRRITLGAPASLPECQPGDGIFFRGWDDRSAATQTQNVAIADRSDPVPLVNVRSSITSTLNLVTRTFADLDLLRATLAPGTVLLLDTPVKYGYERCYISVADATYSRVSRNQARQWSLVSLPFVVVSQPAGLSYGVLGTRWTDLCVANGGSYATFGDATSAGVSWQTIIYGGGSSAGTGPAYRSWAVVKSDFATWSAVNTGGRTWEQLLEGS